MGFFVELTFVKVFPKLTIPESHVFRGTLTSQLHQNPFFCDMALSIFGTNKIFHKKILNYTYIPTFYHIAN